MNKIKIFGFGLGLLVLVLISLFLLVSLFKPKMAGVNINTTPSSKVLINNQQVGVTPYRDFLKPGNYVLRLVPEIAEGQVESYDAEISLEEGVETVIRREFGDTQTSSSGYILTFEKIERGKSSISVISEPDFAEVSLDGKSRAITPYKNSSLMPGEHEIAVRMDGFTENSFKVKTFKGYELLVIVKLAQSGNQKETEDANKDGVTPAPTVFEPKDKGMGFVEVIETPTGFLRVRAEPSTLGAEVGQAEPGKKYVLVGVDERTGWYKIEYEAGVSGQESKAGWVSNQYAKKVAD